MITSSKMWVESVLRGMGSISRQNNLRRAARRSLLQFEGLEERVVPTTYYVTNLSSLTQAIANSNTAGGTNSIVFETTNTITLTSALPTITDNLTITGPGTVSGGNDYSLFTIGSTATVSISNLTIEDGYAVNGGGIENLGTLSINSCTLVDNVSTKSGGGIYSTGSVSVGGLCSFAGNNAGYATSANGSGGAVYIASGSLTITGTADFNGNYADLNAGAIYNAGTATISGSTLENNTADYSTSDSASEGGAIDNEGSLKLNNIIMNGNIALHEGGAIFNDGVMMSTGGTFEYNYTSNPSNLSDSYVLGGGIYNDDQLTMNGGEFLNNQAGFHGGAIYNTGNALLNGVAIYANESIKSGAGGIGNVDGTLSLTGCVLEDNVAAKNGGAIRNYNGGTVNISNCQFDDNAASDATNGQGGAIYSGESNTSGTTNETLNINGVNTFVNNNAGYISSPNGSGGAIYINAGVLSVSGTTLFNGNYADEDGGAIYNLGSATLSGCTFENNTATYTIAGYANGGAIFNAGSLTLNYCQFNGNQANVDGGAIYNSNTLNLYDVDSFVNNYSGSSGGAIYGKGGTLYFTGTDSFTNNQSGSNGGAIFASGTLTVFGVDSFADNYAGGSGGGIYMGNGGTLYLIGDESFTNNQAYTYGGAIYNAANTGPAYIDSGFFEGNTLVNNGGAIYNLGTFTVIDSSFIDNSNFSLINSGGGGAVYNSGYFIASDCAFNGNGYDGTNYANNGGAIYTSGDSTITDCIFTDNSASTTGGGGAIYNLDVLTVSGSTFNGDSNANYGGAIYTSDDSLITNCTFVDNSASTSGGGIYTTGALSIADSTITGNSAPTGGGIRVQSGTASMLSTIVAGNSTGSAASDISGNLNISDSIYNLIGTGGSGSLSSSNNQIGLSIAQAGLGTLAYNGGPTPTVALLSGSAALQSGGPLTTLNGAVAANATNMTVNDPTYLYAYLYTGEEINVGGELTRISGMSGDTISVNSPFSASISSGAWIVPATDQRGFSRTVNGKIDVGAFESGLAVITNPVSTIVNTGQNAAFTAAAGVSASIQWQVNSGSGFSNIANGGVYSGSTTGTLTITGATPAMNGYLYLAIFTTTSGATIASSVATFNVDSIILQPTNQSTNVGQIVNLTADTALGSPTDSVQWMVNTGGGFKPISNGGVYSGSTTNNLTITGASSSMNGYQYEAVFTNSAGQLTTSAATLTVVNDSIISQPTNQIVAAGQTATFTANTSFGSPPDAVEWLMSTGNGASFYVIFGATSSTLSITGTTAAMNGYQYYAVFVNAAGTIATNIATLGVDSITTEPGNQTIVSGQIATFTAATALGSPSDTVQWYVNQNSGAGFTRISNGGLYSGATSATLTITGATTAMSGYQYRAVFTNVAGALISNSATLTVTQDQVNVSINSSVNPAYYGSVVTFSSNVSAASPGAGTPTGSVTFYDGITPLSTSALIGGVATFSSSALAVGSHSISAVYLGDANFSNGTSAALTQVVKYDPPTVQGVVINPGQGTIGSSSYLGNSRVLSIKVNFNQPVDISSLANAFTLTNIGTPNGGASNGYVMQSAPTTNTAIGIITVTPSGSSGTTTSATLTFSNYSSAIGSTVEGGSLTDGLWNLSVSGVTSGGTPMSSLYTTPAGSPIVRLFGDYTGAGVVNSSDLGPLGTTYGQLKTNSAYLEAFDSSGSGEIDSTDLGRFGQNFGLTV